jgi:transcriptional regulator with XRE-family HTH domain
MIDFRQIRAARALLNWSQADLAQAAQMATSSIKNIESENSTARKETLALIHDAFDRNGIEFLPGTGVRLKNDIVAVHDGKNATAALLDSIYAHAQTSVDREVCIIGLDETFSVETDGLLLLANHIDRLTKAGIRERILTCEGDTRFLNAPESYRWLPRQYFTRNAPIYIYGDRIAIHTGSLKRRTVIVEQRALAMHLRMLFALLWDKVSLKPPTDITLQGEQPRIRAVG